MATPQPQAQPGADQEDLDPTTLREEMERYLEALQGNTQFLEKEVLTEIEELRGSMFHNQDFFRAVATTLGVNKAKKKFVGLLRNPRPHSFVSEKWWVKRQRERSLKKPKEPNELPPHDTLSNLLLEQREDHRKLETTDLAYRKLFDKYQDIQLLLQRRLSALCAQPIFSQTNPEENPEEDEAPPARPYPDTALPPLKNVVAVGGTERPASVEEVKEVRSSSKKEKRRAKEERREKRASGSGGGGDAKARCEGKEEGEEAAVFSTSVLPPVLGAEGRALCRGRHALGPYPYIESVWKVPPFVGS